MYWAGRGSDVIVPERFSDQFGDLKLSPPQLTFLYCLISTCGHMSLAAQAARINRSTHYWWLEYSENKDDYNTAFNRTRPLAAQALLDKAIERAAHGVEEPVFYKGEVVGFVNKFSDQLMITLLKGEMPEKYKDRQDIKVGNSGEPGQPFKLDPGREVLSDQKLAALLSLGDKLIEAKKAEKVEDKK